MGERNNTNTKRTRAQAHAHILITTLLYNVVTGAGSSISRIICVVVLMHVFALAERNFSKQIMKSDGKPCGWFSSNAQSNANPSIAGCDSVYGTIQKKAYPHHVCKYGGTLESVRAYVFLNQFVNDMVSHSLFV